MKLKSKKRLKRVRGSGATTQRLLGGRVFVWRPSGRRAAKNNNNSRNNTPYKHREAWKDILVDGQQDALNWRVFAYLIL